MLGSDSISFLARIEDWLVHHATSMPWIGALTLITGGILFWGIFNTGLNLTNTEAFCVSCHEMRNNVYQEYQESQHYRNRTGVRATCPDCHVPRHWADMLVRKITASNELLHHFKGSIDSREKFLSRRLDLARIVWDTMESNDSLECRNCHEYAVMDTTLQTKAADRIHQQGFEHDITCIICHRGVVHDLPEDALDKTHELFEDKGIECNDCHIGLTYGDEGSAWE